MLVLLIFRPFIGMARTCTTHHACTVLAFRTHRGQMVFPWSVENNVATWRLLGCLLFIFSRALDACLVSGFVAIHSWTLLYGCYEFSEASRWLLSITNGFQLGDFWLDAANLWTACCSFLTAFGCLLLMIIALVRNTERAHHARGPS